MTTEEALRKLHAERTNEVAWDTVISSVYEPLLAYVASLLVTFRDDLDEAADIVHSSVISFYSRWRTGQLILSSEAEVLAYLRRSCRNLLIDHYRRDRTARPLVDFLSLTFNAAFEVEQETLKAIFIGEVIAKLSNDCATLFHAYVTENLSLAELAEQMGVSPAALYSRWYRCIQSAKGIAEVGGQGPTT